MCVQESLWLQVPTILGAVAVTGFCGYKYRIEKKQLFLAIAAFSLFVLLQELFVFLMQYTWFVLYFEFLLNLFGL